VGIHLTVNWPSIRTVNRSSKWQELAERVSRLKNGQSLVLEGGDNPMEQARKIRNGLYYVRACSLVRRRVSVVNDKIVITRTGTRRALSEL
jgi:hypothetical protein